jgi:hypothetical protein
VGHLQKICHRLLGGGLPHIFALSFSMSPSASPGSAYSSALRLSGTHIVPSQYSGLDEGRLGSATIANRAHVFPVRTTLNWSDSTFLDLQCHILCGKAHHHNCRGRSLQLSLDPGKDGQLKTTRWNMSW